MLFVIKTWKNFYSDDRKTHVPMWYGKKRIAPIPVKLNVVVHIARRRNANIGGAQVGWANTELHVVLHKIASEWTTLCTYYLLFESSFAVQSKVFAHLFYFYDFHFFWRTEKSIFWIGVVIVDLIFAELVKASS